MNRSAATLEKWRRIVDEQSSSDQTVAEYCRHRGIAASSLFAWKRRLRRAVTASTFVEAKVSAGTAGGQALQADSGQGADAIEIVCDGGRRIIVRRGFDSAALGEVVKTLEALA